MCCGLSFEDWALDHFSPQRCPSCRTTGWWDSGIPNPLGSATACSSRWLPLRCDLAGERFPQHRVPDSRSRSSCPGRSLFIPAPSGATCRVKSPPSAPERKAMATTRAWRCPCALPGSWFGSCPLALPRDRRRLCGQGGGRAGLAAACCPSPFVRALMHPMMNSQAFEKGLCLPETRTKYNKLKIAASLWNMPTSPTENPVERKFA